MRKRNVRKELEQYPFYMYTNGALVRTVKPGRWDKSYQLHHFITTQWEQENPEKFVSVVHLQKLVLLPTQMHIDLHARVKNFKEKYGLDIQDVLFDWKHYKESEDIMISAKTAREKSDSNHIKMRIAAVEKLIKNAMEKGKYEIFVMGEFESEVLDELEKSGFEYEKQVNGWKIRW